MPRQFVSMIAAEVRKVFTRGSGLAALATALVVGLLAVAAMWQVRQWGEGGPSFNGVPVDQIVQVNGVTCAGWALRVRNFFVLPLFLLLATASSVAGEYGARTLRELIVRPVPRWSVLAAKVVAQSVLSISTLVLTLVPSLGMGLLLFGLPEAGVGAPTDAPGWIDVIGAYAATFLSDLGLCAIAVLVSLLVGSVGGVVVGIVLLLMADVALRAALSVAGMVGFEQAASLTPWTLGNALACWEGYQEGWNPAQFGALGAFTLAALVIATVRFDRMDVP